MLKLKYANIIIFISIFLHISNLFSQDTTNIVKDSIKIYPPLMASGKVLLLDSTSFCNISKYDIQKTSYTTLFDILKTKNFAYPLSLGFYGQNNSFAFFGAYPHSISVRFSNTPINEQDIGIFNLSQFPPEQIDNAQIFIGSDAIILSNNSSGAFINLQESIYNTKNPYSKIVYSQASDDFIGADVVFSQNFAKNWNLAVGLRTLSSPGRFTNSNLKISNIRASIRYNIDSLTAISLSENFLNYSIGENGGVNYLTTLDLYDPIAAIVVLNSFSESTARNNLILDFNKIFSPRMHRISLSSKLFFSFSNNKINDKNYIFVKPSDSIQSINYIDYYIGNSTIFENQIGNFDINLGIDSYFSKIQQSEILDKESCFNYSIFELFKYHFTDRLQLSFGTRFSEQFSKSAFSYGGKLEFAPDSNSKLFIDLSNSERIPSLIEGNLKSENHFLGILGFENKWNFFEITGQIFARQIKNCIIFSQSIDSTIGTQSYFITKFENSSPQNIFGLNLNFKIEPIKHIIFEGFAQLNYSTINNQRAYLFPLIYAGADGYYNVNIGSSQAQVGIDFEFLSSFKGFSYFPGHAGYYLNPYKSKLQNNGINLFARLKLGNAFIRIEFRNLLGSNYYYVPFYPELGRHLRFIVNWAFMN